jgi:hypothetical protein
MANAKLRTNSSVKERESQEIIDERVGESFQNNQRLNERKREERHRLRWTIKTIDRQKV